MSKTPSARDHAIPAEEGDAGPFLEALARRYRKALNRFFERRMPYLQADTEDLTQEVFTRLAKNRSHDEIINLDSYLFQAASNVLTDHIRRRKVRHIDDHILFDEIAHADEDFSPERVLIGKREVERVLGIIQELPHRTRAAFVLHRFEDLTYAEIARRLGVSRSAVEKHIARALKRITEATEDSQ